jgi:hypothetical protein
VEGPKESEISAQAPESTLSDRLNEVLGCATVKEVAKPTDVTSTVPEIPEEVQLHPTVIVRELPIAVSFTEEMVTEEERQSIGVEWASSSVPVEVSEIVSPDEQSPELIPEMTTSKTSSIGTVEIGEPLCSILTVQVDTESDTWMRSIDIRKVINGFIFICLNERIEIRQGKWEGSQFTRQELNIDGIGKEIMFE